MADSVTNVLIEAINDEYKARATYRKVISEFGEIRPFINIVDAESRHIEALLTLFEKYNVVVPEDCWESHIQTPHSILEACQAGIEAEIENAEMYNRLLKLSDDYPDIQQVLKQLQRASKENHLPAFQRCAEREGGQGHRRRHGCNP